MGERHIILPKQTLGGIRAVSGLVSSSTSLAKGMPFCSRSSSSWNSANRGACASSGTAMAKAGAETGAEGLV
jgi:hypothetical protein